MEPVKKGSVPALVTIRQIYAMTDAIKTDCDIGLMRFGTSLRHRFVTKRPQPSNLALRFGFLLYQVKTETL